MDHVSATLQRFMALHPREMDLSLGRLMELLVDLGNPHLSTPPVIHVAGTNGKGSTIAFMRSILEAGQKSIHVYTSPHLVNFNERIYLGSPGGGGNVTDDLLIEAMLWVERVNDGRAITFFEITTAIAFKLFAERPADILLLEVGLGGRLDATNVIDNPLATVITSIAMDHERFLGDKVEQIAREKAGILKPGAPATSAVQSDPVRGVLVRQAARHGVKIRFGNEDWSAIAEQGRLVYQDDNGLIDAPLPKLMGRYQIQNAGLAIASLRAAGLEISGEDHERGIRNADWPARMQPLRAGYLVDQAPAGSEVWLDGGHNPNAGEAIATFLADLEERSDRPIYLICGMLNTKDPHGYLAPFAGLVRSIIAVPVRSSNAGRDPEELASVARGVGIPAETAADVSAALDRITAEWSEARGPRILICGSLYFAGEVLAENGTAPK